MVIERIRRIMSFSKTGNPFGMCCPFSWSLMNLLTILSSSEWKLITTNRPPIANISKISGNTFFKSSSSLFIKILIPWKALVAGCLFFSHAGFASLTMFASCSVLVIGFSSLARVIARAILLEYLSSPYSLYRKNGHCSFLFLHSGSSSFRLAGSIDLVNYVIGIS